MYKELMTMGFITLLVTIYTAADRTSVFASYSTEIDFVGYVTFFVAIFFVAHALYIMLLSMRTSKLYERLHRLTVAKAVEMYTESQKLWWERFKYRIPYLPVSSIRQKMEFKIIQSLFRDTYWLPSDFDYGSYLSRCFEKYSLKMINIGWTSWIVMIALGFINYLRVEYLSPVEAFSCSRLHDDYNATVGADTLRYFESDTIESMGGPHDDVRRNLLKTASRSCTQLNVAIFLICGSSVVIYAFFLFITGRFYYERLIQRTGISNISDYPKFLMFEESISLKISSNQRERKLEIEINDKVSKKSKRRMSINTLRKNVNVLLKEPQVKNDEKIFKKISQGIEKSRHVATVKKAIGTSLMAKKFRTSFESMKSIGSSASIGEEEWTPEKRAFSPADELSDYDSDAPVDEPLIYRQEKENSGVRQTLQVMARQASNLKQVSLKRIGSLKNIGAEKKKPEPPVRRRNMIINIRKDDKDSPEVVDSAEDIDTLTSIEQFKLFKLKERDAKNTKMSDKESKGMMMSYLRHHNSTFITNDNKNMKLSEDLSEIYFFENPDLYFKAVEYAIMLNSLYLSLWACNFISVVQFSFNNAWIVQIFMLIPLLIVLPLLGEIVKVSSLLEAIADLDIDVIGSVLEEMEDKTRLIQELRLKILSRIVGESDDKKRIVARLFKEIDIDKNGLISPMEMRQMLRALSLHYSDAKFLRLYRAIDEDLNGSISEFELTLLIFPDMIIQDDIVKRNKILKQRSREIDGSRRNSIFSKPGLFSMLKKYAYVSPSSDIPERRDAIIGKGADSLTCDAGMIEKVADVHKIRGSSSEYENAQHDSSESDDNESQSTSNAISCVSMVSSTRPSKDSNGVDNNISQGKSYDEIENIVEENLKSSSCRSHGVADDSTDRSRRHTRSETICDGPPLEFLEDSHFTEDGGRGRGASGDVVEGSVRHMQAMSHRSVSGGRRDDVSENSAWSSRSRSQSGYGNDEKDNEVHDLEDFDENIEDRVRGRGATVGCAEHITHLHIPIARPRAKSFQGDCSPAAGGHGVDYSLKVEDTD